MSNGMTITKVGRQALTKALTGKELHFTRAVIGDGKLGTKNPYDLTALISPKQYLAIQSMRITGTGTCETVFDVTNQGLKTGFWVREYGLLANDPDTGNEILYAYTNKGDECGYLEAQSGTNLINFSLTLMSVVDQAPNVTATISTTNNYVTISRLEGRIEDLYASDNNISGVWTYGKDSQKRFTPTTWQNFKLSLLGVTDIQSLNARLETVETNLARTLLALETKGLYPDCTHYLIEDFKNTTQCDTFTCNITSIITGDDSIDCEPVAGIWPGSWYTVTDGINSENVQVSTVNIENGIQRIILVEPIKNTYILNSCRMFRTNAIIANDKASGSIARNVINWYPLYTWTGAPSSGEATQMLTFSTGNANNFYTYNIAFTDKNTAQLRTNTLHGRLVAKDGYYLDCSNAYAVNGFDVLGDAPYGASIFFLFKAEGETQWFRLNPDGTPEHVAASSNPTETDLKTNGNTLEDIIAFTDVPGLKGKRIRLAIGLFTTDAVNAVPSINLGIKITYATQKLVTSLYSAEYELGSNAQIAQISGDISTSGTGTISLFGKVTYANGTASNWLPVESLAGVNAAKLQIRSDCSVSALSGSNAGSCTINKIEVIYANDINAPANGITSYIYSITDNWYQPVKQCRMTLKHLPLEQSNIACSVSFRPEPTIVRGENLGTGTGERKTFQMAHTNGIKYDSVKLYIDGQEITSGFDINTQSARITYDAPNGSIVYCDYEYGWQSEQWHDMTLSSRIDFPDFQQSEYRFALPDSDTVMNICAVRIALIMKSGTSTKEAIGTGTGQENTYKLAHHIKDGKITVYAGSTALKSSAVSVLDDTQYIKAVASYGTKLYASYNWISETPEIYQFTAIIAQ